MQLCQHWVHTTTCDFGDPVGADCQDSDLRNDYHTVPSIMYMFSFLSPDSKNCFSVLNSKGDYYIIYNSSIISPLNKNGPQRVVERIVLSHLDRS